MNSIRAIGFDLDNTLWDVWPVIRRAEQAMYEYLAAHYPRVVAVHTVETMREARERTALAYPQMQHDFTFLRQQTLRDHARDFSYAEDMAEKAFDVFIQARNQVELYADTLPALEALRGRYRLFTISNGNADLTKIGLARFFERTVAARQAGALKPDPSIFHKAIEGTDLAPAEVVYVGDDPELDVVGARRAGMGAIWINRTEAAWPEALAAPWHTVRVLTDLPALLTSLPVP